MKKLFLLVFAGTLSACSAQGQSVELKTTLDSVSYAFGLDMGEQYKQAPVEISGDLAGAGVRDALNNTPKMTMEEVRDFLIDFMNNRLPEITQQKVDAAMAEVAEANPNASKTESGLMYEILVPGGEKLRGTMDKPVVHYVGKLLDGTQFDSSYDRNEPLTIELDRVIPGWTEGLMLVGKGGKIRLWIPPELGYGERASGPIPPNSVLFFEIEIQDVIRGEEE